MDWIREPGRIYQTDRTGKIVAEVTFPSLRDGLVDINHTFVDESLRGQGVAALLMREVAETLRRERKKARLTCSYAQKWFSEHADYSDIPEKSQKADD